jgi:signal transduction histidine kinase
VTSATAVASSDARSVLRDPVLVLPAVVAAGLGVGWLGANASASGARIAVDLALAWTLVAASLVALERARWRTSRILLCAAAFAVLAADLQWARSDVLWTLGFLLAGLWLALLVQLVLTFPGGRPWSAAARVTVISAYAVVVIGQVARVLVVTDGRDLLAVKPDPDAALLIARVQAGAAVLVGVVFVFLCGRRLVALSGPARRSQWPLLAAGVVSTFGVIAWLGFGAATGDSVTLDVANRALHLLVPIAFVAGIVWSRLGRTDASDLVVELQTEGGTSLRERLAQTLGDPTLELAYRLADGRYVAASGEAFELPSAPDRAVTVVSARGEEIAVLVHDPVVLDEPELVDSVRLTAGLVLENERLAAEVRAQLAEVRASRSRIVAATDAERRRIERDLHDGAQQRLVALSVALGLAAARDDVPASVSLSRAQDELEQAIGELRELARGIHPTLLREDGLAAAVEALARRMPIPVRIEGSASGHPPEAVELAAYFLVAEALTNVVKHASATEATVRLERAGDVLAVSVVDNGVGGAAPEPDSGLAGLRDRLDVLDSTLVIESEHGCGTTIRAEIPCGS